MNKLPTIKEKDWKFIMILGNKRMTLSEIQKKLNSKNGLSETQKIFSNLEENGFLNSQKIGRQRYVQLNESGIYFYDFYKKISQK